MVYKAHIFFSLQSEGLEPTMLMRMTPSSSPRRFINVLYTKRRQEESSRILVVLRKYSLVINDLNAVLTRTCILTSAQIHSEGYMSAMRSGP